MKTTDGGTLAATGYDNGRSGDSDGDYSKEESNQDEEYDDECPTIKLSCWDKQRIRQPWRKTLIVKILGRKIGYSYLTKRLIQLWKHKGSVVFTDLGNEFYLVKFTNDDDDYYTVFFDGPCLISDHILAVRQWQPNFFPEEAVIDRAVILVQIPNLLIEYYDKPFLNRIGNRIGRTV